jgi:hypothetical protein
MLLGTGLGAACGLQAWRLAAALSGNGLRWQLAPWIVLGYALLGLAVAATGGRAVWWKRGAALGLLFAIPGAFFAYASGWEWLSAGQAIAAPVAGLLIALLVDVVRPAPRQPARPSEPRHSQPEAASADIRQRLAEGQAELERLDAERRRRRDPRIGKTVEERIIWGELLELELQDIDERVSRTENADDPREGEES